jgi:hypothetical protein
MKRSKKNIDIQRANAFQSRLRLSPLSLTDILDRFEGGDLRAASLLFDKIKQRDDAVAAVSQKRELSVALLDWEIQTVNDSPEAERHKVALKQFYNSVRCTNAIDENERGGIAHLIRQMMTSVGHRYAVHEIIWEPRADGLSAEFRFVPLAFFENRTARLRFLSDPFLPFGEELEEGGWLVTTGTGLMPATSIAYLFKQMPLRSWVSFCEKAGIPGLHAKTNAQKGSEDWNTLVEAMEGFSSDWALVTSDAANISALDLRGNGESPHAGLVDRMDRAIARIWLGGDLGTLSAEGAVGSNSQKDESATLQAAYTVAISEALQEYVDRKVIEYRFGEEPLAYFRLQPRKNIDLVNQLKVDDFLIRAGVPRSKANLAAYYGRSLASKEEEIAQAPVGAAPIGNSLSSASHTGLSVDQLEKTNLALAPLATRLREIAAIDSFEDRQGALKKLREDLPILYAEVRQASPNAVAAFETMVGEAMKSFANSQNQIDNPFISGFRRRRGNRTASTP